MCAWDNTNNLIASILRSGQQYWRNNFMSRNSYIVGRFVRSGSSCKKESLPFCSLLKLSELLLLLLWIWKLWGWLRFGFSLVPNFEELRTHSYNISLGLHGQMFLRCPFVKIWAKRTATNERNRDACIHIGVFSKFVRTFFHYYFCYCVWLVGSHIHNIVVQVCSPTTSA